MPLLITVVARGAIYFTGKLTFDPVHSKPLFLLMFNYCFAFYLIIRAPRKKKCSEERKSDECFLNFKANDPENIFLIIFPHMPKEI